MSGNINQKDGIKLILKKISSLKKKIGSLVTKRMKEFKKNNNLFSELCFCILTANYTAEGGIKIQNSVDFSNLSESKIKKALIKFGHRFPNVRANYLYLAKSHFNSLKNLKNFKNSFEKREWLVKNIKGLGYKEASHFLRNIGYTDVAIIDRHILNVLKEYNLIKPPKTLTKNSYLKIEKTLERISKLAKLTQGELDLYLWYLKTGKVLK